MAEQRNRARQACHRVAAGTGSRPNLLGRATAGTWLRAPSVRDKVTTPQFHVMLLRHAPEGRSGGTRKNKIGQAKPRQGETVLRPRHYRAGSATRGSA